MSGQVHYPGRDLGFGFRAWKLGLVEGFDEFLSLDDLPSLTLFAHQEDTVRRVLGRMGGRALLADEVGLGKTIEAGVILREYVARGMVRRALLLVPASLLLQWHEELTEKLQIEAVVCTRPGHWGADIALASIDTAKRAENAKEIWGQPYDLLIVDEAHRLKESSTANWRFVNGIRKRFLLLLTATPVQNELRELYNMVSLLRPGQLRTYAQFKRDFMLDKRTPRNPVELRSLLSPVLVRHTRGETGIRFPGRHVQSESATMGSEEREAYRTCVSMVRRCYGEMKGNETRSKRQANLLPMILLLREVCSSPQAARRTVSRWIASPNTGLAQFVPEAELEELDLALGRVTRSAKATRLLDHVLAHPGEKSIVFTEFVETAATLTRALRGRDLDVVTFHGGLNQAAKAQTIGGFRDHAQVMVSTEAGGEGHNLQFCSRVVNYDLPWNPMRVEQRIGRVHRLGQERDVNVVNLYCEDTVEAYVVYLLHQKIRMFETIVGELDLILSGLGKRSFEGRFADLVLGARDEEEFERMVQALGDQLEEARLTYERTKRTNALLLD